MSAALRVIAAGPGVTLQDHGRDGYLRFGVTVAGPMDPAAFATANLAVGAPLGTAAPEARWASRTSMQGSASAMR